MLRRFTAFLLIAALCCPIAAAETMHPAAVGDLAVVSQQDRRFQIQAYRYKGLAFRCNGCGPSSFTNALIAAINVTDRDLAADLMLDMLHLLTAPKKPSDRSAAISASRLAYLNAAPDTRDPAVNSYPAIDQALIDYGGSISYSHDFVTPEVIADIIGTPLDAPQVIVGRFTRDARYPTLIALIDLLYDAGYRDATITLAHLGAGTKSTSGPLRSGNAGHYLCLHLPVGEFYETGAVYALDSLPRALDGESYGGDHTYRSTYDFVEGARNRYSLNAFLNTYEAERVKNTIIRLKPYGDALERLDAALAAATPTDLASLQSLADVRASQLKTIVTFGVSHAFVSLYPPQN